MFKKLLKTIFLSLICAVALAPTFSMAAEAYQIDPAYRPSNLPFNIDYDTSYQEGCNIPDPKPEHCLETSQANTILILEIIAGALLFFAAPLAVIIIAVSGLRMVIGGASPDQVESAKKSLIYAIGGLFVIILSYTIVRITITVTIESASGL
jgi:hypothetical protein